jgi:hypothetical protein
MNEARSTAISWSGFWSGFGAEKASSATVCGAVSAQYKTKIVVEQRFTKPLLYR